MKKFFHVLGTAAFLTASLFTINKTAKAEMATFTEENIPVFSCMRGENPGEYVTMARIVDRTRFVRFANTVVEERESFRSSEPLFTWNKTLANGRYVPESRCMTVSTRLTNHVSGIAAYLRNLDPTISNEDSYIQAVNTLSNLSRSTRVSGVNKFGEFVSEEVILPSDFQIGSFTGLRQGLSVANRPTDATLSTIVTLSGANAIFNEEVLNSLKVGLNVAAGGQAPDFEVELPIQE